MPVARPAPARKRRPHRRDELLRAAAALFHERGYDATGIDDIGAAVGISGPGVYRHFRNKLDILETLLREQGESGLREVRAIVADAGAPEEALAALIGHYATTMAANPTIAVVAMYERRMLSPETRRVVERWERENTRTWIAVVSGVRPDLGSAEAQALVHAALRAGVAVCNYDSGLDPAALRALIGSMVRAVLDGRSGSGSGSRSGSGAVTRGRRRAGRAAPRRSGA